MAEVDLAAPEGSPVAETQSDLAAATATATAVVPDAAPDAAPVSVMAQLEINGGDSVASDQSSGSDGAGDHKRKLRDLEINDDDEAHEKKREISSPDVMDDAPVDKSAIGAPDKSLSGDEGSKDLHADQGIERQATDESKEVQKLESASPVREQGYSLVNSHDGIKKNIQEESIQDSGPSPMITRVIDMHSADQLSGSDSVTSRRITIPNNKVGVLIGRGGDTIKSLQFQSSARIQITRDIDSDPGSSTRAVELSGTLKSIDKAEGLIKDVIAEADAGGSPSLVAKGSTTTTQSDLEQVEMQVPNEKVGFIIGKGGEKIKNMQMKSGARIQVITHDLSEGDASVEKTIRISGNKLQIESARAMIKDIVNQVQTRSSNYSGGYNQQAFRPHLANSQSHWGPRAPPPNQHASGYNYQQRGMHQSQSTPYPQGNGPYAQQPPPRGSMGAGWDQRSAIPAHHHHQQTGSYDYYGQGSQTQIPPSQTLPGTVPTNHAATSYNYGQPEATNYGMPAHAQQSYGQTYDQVKYDNQASNQQYYGQQPSGSQPGVYGQQMNATQSGYTQQTPYNNQPYGGVQTAAQPFGTQGPAQTGDPMYQGITPSNYSSYGQSMPAQQSYPYGQGTTPQQAQVYGQSYGAATTEGYNQPMPGYGQNQGAQAMPSYTQGQQSGGYGQYSAQSGYGGQLMPNNASYAYQGSAGTENYANTSASAAGYGSAAAPVATQSGYGHAGYAPQTSGFEQSAPVQPSYGSNPGTAPGAYT